MEVKKIDAQMFFDISSKLDKMQNIEVSQQNIKEDYLLSLFDDKDAAKTLGLCIQNYFRKWKVLPEQICVNIADLQNFHKHLFNRYGYEQELHTMSYAKIPIKAANVSQGIISLQGKKVNFY